ncbi:Beta-propeller repeat protein [compost metagenome]
MKTHVITRALLTLLLLTVSLIGAYSRHSFIENIGQISDQSHNARPDIVAKYAAGNSLNIFLAKTAVHYQFSTGNELYRMDVKLIGANPNARIIKGKPAAFKEQYHIGDLKKVARTFEKIIYKDIYPNIDWVFYFNSAGKLEHDFVIKPGGEVSDIKLEYQGANSLKIDLDGNLIASTMYGTIKEPKPYSYDQATGKTVSSSYVLNGNILNFETFEYNIKSTLIIDPVIDWSTYLGGSEYDEIRDTKIGKDGFVYVVGSTNSLSNIATNGAHLTSFQGGNNSNGADAFISKFSPDGNCVWSTYYGGPSADLGISLAFDTAGYLFVAGRTNSTTGIATIGSHQEIKAGNLSSYDAFLLKIDTAGNPVWSTYFGGAGSEGTQAIAICSDRNDNIYISGNTNSPAGIATQGSFQATKSGGDDGFIAKFNNQGILQWSTYYGSTLADNINNMTTDGSGNLIVVGHTQSTAGLSTVNAHLEIGNGNIDGFVAKFDSNGQRLWATYYGGSGNDLLYSVTTDSTNAIYCSGMTDSDSDISTVGAHQTAIGGNTEYDALIAKFNPNGSLNWSTYYGGVEGERSYSILFSDNKLYFSGNSSSSSNITTVDGIKPVFNNSVSEGVLATFSPNGQRLWSTYLGGDAVDVIRAVALDESGNVFLGGETLSPAGLSTNGAHQTNFGGNRDGWLIKIKMCDLPQAPAQILGNNEVCENSQQQYTIPPISGAGSYSWILPVGWTGTGTNDTVNIIVGSASGEIKVVALNACGNSDTISLEVTVNPAPHPQIDRNGSILSVTQTFNSYQWLLNSNPINGATGMTHVALENGIYTLQVQGDKGCEGLSNEIVIDDMVSVDNLLKENGIHIYPNPFISKAYVQTAIPLKIVVVDISGRVMLTKYNIKTNTMLDLHVLPIGNFYFKMFDHKTNEYLGSAFMVKTEQ